MKGREGEKERHNLKESVAMSICVFAYTCVLMCMWNPEDNLQCACLCVLFVSTRSLPVPSSSLRAEIMNSGLHTQFCCPPWWFALETKWAIQAPMEDISHSIHHTWKIQRHPKQMTATAPDCPRLLHDKVLLLERQPHTLTTEKQRTPSRTESKHSLF